MSSIPNPLILYFFLIIFTANSVSRFYFEVKSATLPGFSWTSLRGLTQLAGGAEDERVRRWEEKAGWLVGQQTEAATSPQWLSVLAAGNTGLEARLTAAKCRSILALNGLWSHWRRTSIWALITVDTQRLPWVIERPLRLILHNNHLWFEFHLVS